MILPHGLSLVLVAHVGAPGAGGVGPGGAAGEARLVGGAADGGAMRVVVLRHGVGDDGVRLGARRRPVAAPSAPEPARAGPGRVVVLGGRTPSLFELVVAS